MTGVSGMTGVLGVVASGVAAPGVEAAGVEAADDEAPGVEAAGVEAPGVVPGVVPGVAGITTTEAEPRISAPVRGSTRGVDVIKRASLIR